MNKNGHKRTVHLDLSEHGFAEQWVDLRNPWFMSQKQFNELVERSKEDAQAFLREMVTAWSVKDVDDQELRDPKVDDFESVPAGVINVLSGELQGLFEATLPKASRTASSST